MAFDFDPDLSEEIEQIEQEKPTKSAKENSVYNTETSLVNNGIKNQNVITVNNLLGLTQSHIEDDNECREVISNLTEELNNSIHLMSVKEMLEYLKVKIREREFHVRCIFEALHISTRSRSWGLCPHSPIYPQRVQLCASFLCGAKSRDRVPLRQPHPQ